MLLQAPKNMEDLRQLLGSALGNSDASQDVIDASVYIAASAYYVLYRMVYDLSADALAWRRLVRLPPALAYEAGIPRFAGRSSQSDSSQRHMATYLVDKTRLLARAV